MINDANSEIFEGNPEYIIKTLELYNREAAVVSRELMVLGQTERSREILSGGTFYPIQDWLDVNTCNIIKDAMKMNEPQTIDFDTDGFRRILRIIPIKDVVLLLFDPVQKRMPALLMDAIKMRDSASNLLIAADMIKEPEVSAKVRLEAMRLLRQASHCEILGGGTQLHKTMCDLGKIVKDAAGQIREKGFNVSAEVEKSMLASADSSLIHAAILTLASNCIRFGGDNVKINIKAVRRENNFIIRIDDNGPGISASAVSQKRTGWSDSDSVVIGGEWGMGIPFAEQIARMHGGRLQYLFGTSGGSVCIILPDAEEDVMQSESIYIQQNINPADIELSTVLSSRAYIKSKESEIKNK